MAATQTQIDSYIASIRYAHSLYSGKLSKKGKLSRKAKVCESVRLVLLSYYVRILEDYFEQHDDAGDTYEDYNFFTTAEATDIMQHINTICGTNYYLDITD